MKYVIAVVALWVLAIVATVAIIRERSVFTFLGPLYAICMIGCVRIVQQAQGPRDKAPVGGKS
jgi:hypothetical protein